MCVDLRRGNICMPQQLLDGTQVCPAIDEMAGEGVAQHVGTDALSVEAGKVRELFELLREALPRQVPLRPFGRKQPFGLEHGGLATISLVSDLEVTIESCPGGAIQRHETLATALAPDHQHPRVSLQH